MRCVPVCICACACVQRAGSRAAEDSGTEPGIPARAAPAARAAGSLPGSAAFASFSGSAALTLQMVRVPLPLALL